MGAIVGPQEADDGLRFCEFGRADRVCCVARPTGPSNAQGAPLVGLGPKPRGGGSSSTASRAEPPSPPPPPLPPPPCRRVCRGGVLGPIWARVCWSFSGSQSREFSIHAAISDAFAAPDARAEQCCRFRPVCVSFVRSVLRLSVFRCFVRCARLGHVTVRGWP